MAPPSKLAVATGSVTRLVKEEASYHKELVQQAERIKKLEASEGDENKEYTLRQEKQARQETQNVFPAIRARIEQAVEKLEAELENSNNTGGNADEIKKAEDALAAGRKVIAEGS
ncbi:tubulin binding cofactor A [Didymella exigua CBS 183.55]|uniref:Tubulin-specific chaperone A n=1 Tax=Didymella exigua CBS 183.55 TaxID=1150837 RepID=A0A6A5RWE1_9PLEO|nr:tubulin binding cofactor A [Didymella exigua CBS 183.55]KAF1931893.1 tubulin binding cofactor A [Didymella exigua CBS 183.55]